MNILKTIKKELSSIIEEQIILQTSQFEKRISQLEEELQNKMDVIAEANALNLQQELNDTKEEMFSHLEASSAQMDKAIEQWTWERFKRVQKEFAEAKADLLTSSTQMDKTVERWTWERFKRVQKEFAEAKADLLTSSAQMDKIVERWTWERFKRIQKENEMLRRQIDYTYRDIMVVLEKQLEFVGKHDLELHTDHPIAVNSLDTTVPHGTIRDNTRYPRFIKKCETIFGKDRRLSFLDLGCSGGGMVLDAVLRGHLGIGLEGCSVSLESQRAEWRLLRDNLFTCDISKPFSLVDRKTGELYRFHVITAWEVLEHIKECDLPQLFENIKKHLHPDGYFIASIANYDDIDPDTGVNWHVTVHPYTWWKSKFEDSGFTECSELLETEDLARGGYNPPNAYLPTAGKVDTEKCFHIVVHQ